VGGGLRLPSPLCGEGQVGPWVQASPPRFAGRVRVEVGLRLSLPALRGGSGWGRGFRFPLRALRGGGGFLQFLPDRFNDGIEALIGHLGEYVLHPPTANLAVIRIPQRHFRHPTAGVLVDSPTDQIEVYGGDSGPLPSPLHL